jgi:hypothetical protein
VDTLAFWAAFEAGEENDAGAVVEAMRPIQEAADSGLLVLVVHHVGKAEGRSGGTKSRGSTALPGAVDATLELKPDTGRRRLLHAETRFGGVSDLVIELVEREGDVPTYALVGDAGRLAAEEAEGRVLDHLREHRDAWRSTDEIKAAVTGRASDVGGALARLAAAGRILRVGKGAAGSPYRYAALGTQGEAPA